MQNGTESVVSGANGIEVGVEYDGRASLKSVNFNMNLKSSGH